LEVLVMLAVLVEFFMNVLLWLSKRFSLLFLLLKKYLLKQHCVIYPIS